MTKAGRLCVMGLAAALLPAAAWAAHWQSSDNFGQTTVNGYIVRNDVWGAGAGPQTVWADSGTGWWNWGCWSQQPNTGGVKSYPHAAKAFNQNINNLSGIHSSWSSTTPGSGNYNVAYDIWLNSNAMEVMIWLRKQGAVGPLGSLQATVSISGASWQVYKGTNGANQVVSFVRTSNTNTVSNLDIKAFLTYMVGKSWIASNSNLSEVQAGFEITTAGGVNFQTNSYSAQ